MSNSPGVFGKNLKQSDVAGNNISTLTLI